MGLGPCRVLTQKTPHRHGHSVGPRGIERSQGPPHARTLRHVLRGITSRCCWLNRARARQAPSRYHQGRSTGVRPYRSHPIGTCRGPGTEAATAPGQEAPRPGPPLRQAPRGSRGARDRNTRRDEPSAGGEGPGPPQTTPLLSVWGCEWGPTPLSSQSSGADQSRPPDSDGTHGGVWKGHQRMAADCCLIGEPRGYGPLPNTADSTATAPEGSQPTRLLADRVRRPHQSGLRDGQLA